MVIAGLGLVGRPHLVNLVAASPSRPTGAAVSVTLSVDVEGHSGASYLDSIVARPLKECMSSSKAEICSSQSLPVSSIPFPLFVFFMIPI